MKNHKNRILLTTILLATATPTLAQKTSTPEQFAELGRLCVGRWASQITLIADWPEFSRKQGDKVNGYSTMCWTADRHAFIEQEVIAEGLTTSMYYLDAKTRMIKAVRVSSAGSTSTTTYWKEGDTWHWKHEGAQADGKKLTAEGKLLFEDDNTTMIGDGTSYLDGEKLPHYHDVYKRVGE